MTYSKRTYWIWQTWKAVNTHKYGRGFRNRTRTRKIHTQEHNALLRIMNVFWQLQHLPCDVTKANPADPGWPRPRGQTVSWSRHQPAQLTATTTATTAGRIGNDCHIMFNDKNKDKNNYIQVQIITIRIKQLLKRIAIMSDNIGIFVDGRLFSLFTGFCCYYCYQYLYLNNYCKHYHYHAF